MTTRTHYELLGLPPDADAKAIKVAYRRLTRTAHPDTPTGTDGLFGMITDAYDILRDPGKRAAYDADLARGATGPAAGSYQPPPTRPGGAAEAMMARARARDQANRAAAAAREADRLAAQVERAATDDARRAASGFRPLEPVVIALALTVAFLTRFTGATALLFHVHPGDRIGFDQHWPGDMTLAMLVDHDGVKPTLVALVVATLVGTLGANLRRRLGPVPVAEKAYGLGVAVATVGAGELFLPGSWFLAVLAVLVGGWAAWFAYLRSLPRPATAAQWANLQAWVGLHIRAAINTRH